PPTSYTLARTQSATLAALHSFPTRRSSDLYFRPSTPMVCSAFCTCSVVVGNARGVSATIPAAYLPKLAINAVNSIPSPGRAALRSEEHTSELQSRFDLVCRLLLENKKRLTT